MPVLLVLAFVYPAAPAAAFGMGGGGAAPSVSVGGSMGVSAMTANGGNAAYAHGSPAASNPAVAAMEARQRDAQVAAEIDQARKAGKNVHAAEADRRRGERDLESNHAEEAMLRFNDAERDAGIHASEAAMGTSSRSMLGSVTPGGTELSGAIVH
ncbi:MAG TPA: hypothetical protein VGY99_13025 [Candidatus Binataceae bacterium]|nr:hypothetical protein [Candidatus Binataceae bacterium]